MTQFTILYLSDAHIGHPSYTLDWQLTLNPLLDDFTTMRQERGLVPDLIVFGGDLVFGHMTSAPIVSQFEIARTFLSRISDSFSIPLFVVPGNHDINRARIEDAQQEWLENNIGNDDKLEREARDQTTTWKGILQRQAEWVRFVKDISSNCNYVVDDETNLTSGFVDSPLGPINLIGLNTAWASSPKDIAGALRVGPYQWKKARLLRQKMDGIVVCVGHHPPAWLHSRERLQVEKWLETSTHLFMHGHEHDVWFRPFDQHLRIASGACYQGSTSENVYLWIRLDAQEAQTELTFRTLNTKGGQDCWVPYAIPGKTDDHGVARVGWPFPRSPSVRQSSLVQTKEDTSDIPPPVPVSTPSSLFNDLELQSFILFLDEHLHFRWEPHSFGLGSGDVSIFWPVRLRSPTAIHAVQAFAAAGLARKGAKVCLSLDDFGNTQYSGEMFADTVRNWWTRVGADPSLLSVEYFQQVLSSEHYRNLWRNIQRLLGESDLDMQQVLRLSKYLPARVDAEVTLKEFATKRPRKLLTPTLVWTALLRHWETRQDHKIITLGGFDEQNLWKAWWDVVSPDRSGYIGHLFNPELHRPETGDELPLHMGASPDFEWKARGDVVRWFERDLQVGGDWTQPSRMIPWCFNGCVRLPAFILGGDQEWSLGRRRIAADTDLASISDPKEVKEASELLATVVSRTVL